MDNIHLHSNQPKKTILKEDINKQPDLEYRKSLPYDAMGDYSVMGSLLPSHYFGDDSDDDVAMQAEFSFMDQSFSFNEIPGSEMLHPEIHKLLTNRDIEDMLELNGHVTCASWSCAAEKNYYWTFGG